MTTGLTTQEAQDFEPASDLDQNNNDRQPSRWGNRRNRFLVVAVTAVALSAGTAGVMALQTEPDGDRTESQAETGDRASNETPAPPSSVPTDPAVVQPPADAPDGDSPAEAIEHGTPLSRSGVGSIRAGMTIREAEAATGMDLTIPEGSWDAFGRTCGVFELAGTNHTFVARTSGLVPTDDHDSAVIDAVGDGGGHPSTAEGIEPGMSVEELEATYGQPTRTEPDALSDAPDARVAIYEDGDGFSYGFRIWDGEVADIRSGHVTGLAEFEPCA